MTYLSGMDIAKFRNNPILLQKKSPANDARLKYFEILRLK
jgi:hypothetical protein